LRRLSRITLSLEEVIVKNDVGGRGVIEFLHEALKRKIDNPLEDAMKILEKSSSAIIVTGFNIPPNYKPETDGLIGAVVLARALLETVSNNVLIILDDHKQEDIIKGLLAVLDDKKYRLNDRIDFLVQMNNEYLFRKAVQDKIASIDPNTAVFIEKPSPNREGVMHNMRGINISSYHLDPSLLLKIFREHGIKTIGIGDGGNEVGLGIIEEDIRKYVPYGNICKCPCRAGIASATVTDTVIVSAVSNWAAYALEALILTINGKHDMIHSDREENILIRRAVEMGAIDGVRGEGFIGVDGICPEDHVKILNNIRKISSLLL